MRVSGLPLSKFSRVFLSPFLKLFVVEAISKSHNCLARLPKLWLEVSKILSLFGFCDLCKGNLLMILFQSSQRFCRWHYRRKIQKQQRARRSASHGPAHTLPSSRQREDLHPMDVRQCPQIADPPTPWRNGKGVWCLDCNQNLYDN
jgi:hypothetical protein